MEKQAQQDNILDPEPAGSSATVAFFAAIPRLVWTVLHGWSMLAWRGLLLAYDFFRALPLLQLLFLASCLGLIVTAFPGWINYTVNFTGQETVRVGSAYRLVFVLPGILGFLLSSFKIPIRLPIYLVVFGACAVVYVAGFAFPNPIHTEILKPGDYGLTFWIYLYALPLAGAGFFSRPGLETPLFDWSLLFTQGARSD